jgi:hypothetical protein
MNRIVFATFACLALAACETTYPPPPPPPVETQLGPAPAFRAGDFAWSAEHGSAMIRGQTNFNQGAHHFSCSGQTVVLTPDTPYSRYRIVGLYGSSERAALPVNEVRSRQAARPSVDYSAFVRKSTCDAHDRFSFQGLPPGGWFVIVVAQPASSGGEPMALMRRVDTRAGAVRTLTIE